MPPGQKLQKIYQITSLKPNDRKIASSSCSTSASSHATVSDESCDVDSPRMNRNQINASSFPIGTAVKKYFNGRGWKSGKVVNILQNGMYEVQYENEDGASTQLYTYPLSKLCRLTKTASVHTGTKLAIYWPKEKRYFTAVITKELPRKRENYLICYCHNAVEREWIDLHRHRFRVVVPSSPCSDFFIPDSENSSNAVCQVFTSFGADQQFSQPPKEVSCIEFSSASSNQKNSDDLASNQHIVTLSNMEDIVREVSLGTRSGSDEASREAGDYQESCASYKQSEQQQRHLRSSVSQSFQPTKRTIPDNPECPSMVVSDFRHLHDPCDESEVLKPLHESFSERTSNLSVTNESNTYDPNKGTGDIAVSKMVSTQCETPCSQHKSSQDPRHETALVGSSFNEEQNNHTIPGDAILRCSSLEVTLENDLNETEPTRNQPTFDAKHDASIRLDVSCIDTNNPDGFDAVLSACDSSQDDSDDSSYQQDLNRLQIGEMKPKEESRSVDPVSTGQHQLCENSEIDQSLDKIVSSAVVGRNDDQMCSTEIQVDTQEDDAPSFFILEIDVGSRVEVYWPEDECYYAGVVKKRRTPKISKPHKKPFFLVYDDGESEWIDFREHKVRLLDNLPSTEIEGPSCVAVGAGEAVSHETGVHIKSDHIEKVKSQCLEDAVREGGNDIDLTTVVNVAEISCITENGIVGNDLKVDMDPISPDVLASENNNGNHGKNTFTFAEADDALPTSSSHAMCVGESQSPRRTSRNIHPPNFFSKELDHNLSNHSDNSDYNGFYISPSDGSVSENVGTKTNDQLKLERHSRKAVLDALVSKMYKKRLEADVEQAMEDPEPHSRQNEQIAKAPLQLDDLPKLEVGIRVSVRLQSHSPDRVGTIISSKGMRSCFLVDFSDEKSREWVDFEKVSFQILKRKRGRPKKIRNIVNEDVEFKSNLNDEETGSNILVSGDDFSKIIIGSKVAIFCPNDGEYHRGTVACEKLKEKSFFVEYDSDKESEWIDCRVRQFQSIDTIVKARKRGRPPATECNECDDVANVRIGSKVALWWDGDAKYIGGTITKIRTHSRPFYVVYDDGEAAHWVDLKKYKFKFINNESTHEGKRRKVKSKDDAVEGIGDGQAHDCVIRKTKETFHKNSLSKIRVGSRIDIWWAGDSAYYAATVRKIGSETGQVFIRYDDGEEEWIDLSKNSFRLTSGITGKPNTKFRSGKATSEEDSDLETASSGNTGKNNGVYPDVDNDFVYGDVDKVKVGSRIAVWWTLDKVYYAGKVAKIGEGRKPFFIKYDDNDEEWTDLRKRYFRFLDKK